MRSKAGSECVYLRKHRRMISSRSSGVGRSTKNTASKRPLRSSSGGRVDTSLEVATRNTLEVDSCIQKRNCPMRRRVTELSLELEASPFSISSIHRMHGAARSAVASASRRRDSDSPTYMPMTAAMSSR